MRRIASNIVYTCDGKISLGYVQIEGDRVVYYGQLTEEMPQTEWLQGEISLVKEGKKLRAYYADKLLKE